MDLKALSHLRRAVNSVSLGWEEKFPWAARTGLQAGLCLAAPLSPPLPHALRQNYWLTLSLARDFNRSPYCQTSAVSHTMGRLLSART